MRNGMSCISIQRMSIAILDEKIHQNNITQISYFSKILKFNILNEVLGKNSSK